MKFFAWSIWENSESMLYLCEVFLYLKAHYFLDIQHLAYFTILQNTTNSLTKKLNIINWSFKSNRRRIEKSIKNGVGFSISFVWLSFISSYHILVTLNWQWQGMSLSFCCKKLPGRIFFVVYVLLIECVSHNKSCPRP